MTVQITRQLERGDKIEDIILDRAREFVCSSLDSVTGGVHCSIGGDFKYDYLVTSTLASQAPQADYLRDVYNHNLDILVF